MGRTDDYIPAATPIYGGHNQHSGRPVWRERGIRDHLVMYTFSGSCRVAWTSSGSASTARMPGSIVAVPGDIVLIAPRVAHDYGPPPGTSWGVIWAVFQSRPQWLEWMDWPEVAPGISLLRLTEATVRERVVARLDEAQALSLGGLPNRDLLAMNALEGAFLWCWNQSRGSSRLDQRLKRAIGVMCDRLAEPIDLGTAARAAGVSKSHFSRLFRQHLGTTPQRFLEERRIERACALLRATPLSVQDVAQQTGFASPFYFSLRFKRRIGYAPRAYRAAAASGKL